MVLCLCVLSFCFGSFPDLTLLLNTFVFLWFICCVRFVFLFQNDAALLLESRSANANAEWNNNCVYSQCFCHLVYSNPLLKKKKNLIGPDWIPWWFRQPLRDAIYSVMRINNNIMTSHLLLLSECSEILFLFQMVAAWCDWFCWVTAVCCVCPCSHDMQSNYNSLFKSSPS